MAKYVRAQKMTREDWLNRGLELCKKLFTDAGYKVPPNVRMSCGFPKGTRGKAIGQCWHTTASADKHYEIFVSPELDDPSRVLDVLIHEVVHVVVGVKNNHNKVFKACAKAVGLTGRMTATVASPELKETLKGYIKKLGPYPHGKMSKMKNRSKQSTRLLKCECKKCGCIIRITQKWLDEVGTPSCGCGAGRMKQS